MKLRHDFNSTILAQDTEISMDTWKTGINNNVLVVGSSGSGKTRRFVKPNLLQKNACYVISDPKGTLIKECGSELVEKQDEFDHAYKIRVLNLIDMTKSMHYNPLAYIVKERDIVTLVSFLVENNNYGRRISCDSFWNEMAATLLTAVIGFVVYNLPKEECNLNSVLKVINLASSNDSLDKKDCLDILFEMIERQKGECFEVRYYKRYSSAKGRTKMSILASLSSILAPFELTEVKELVEKDDLDLYSIGDEYSALFVMLDDTSKDMDFLAGILYSQLFHILCRKADAREGGRLKIPCRFFLDDFACVGRVPNFERLIASIRSREISACIILQDESQLESVYRADAQTIIGNCDTYLFMGSSDMSSCESVGKRIRKSPNDVAQMETNKCYVFSGNKIFCNYKYSLEKHPRYKESVYDYESALKVNEKTIYESGEEKRVLVTTLAEHISRVEHVIKLEEKLEEVKQNDRILSKLDYSISKTENDMSNLEIEINRLLEDVQSLLETPEVSNKLRDNVFDSEEEKTFYDCLSAMIHKYQYDRFIQIEPHVHLSEIFEDPLVEYRTGKYKYRLVNQHCDFILRDKRNMQVIAGIEVDGYQHETDEMQIENDQYKNKTFSDNDIPLIRISASEARNNHGWRNRVCSVIREAVCALE